MTSTASIDRISRVLLGGDSTLFTTALDRYIDENKPDPLVRKQMQEWKFEWQENHDDVPTFSFEPTHMISGRLQWKGEYIILPMDVLAYWKGEKEGSLFFSCSIPAGATEFLPAPSSSPARGEDDADTKSDLSKKEIRAANRVHQRMIQRLKSDDYIQMLMSSKSGNDKKSNQQDNASLDLCEATIEFSDSNLEERVHCNDKTAEAVRRAVFSTADSSLDVFDVLLSLPILPTNAHSSGTVVSTEARDDAGTSPSSSCYLDSRQTTGLADRAKLRLLEDAMYDACERAEEDELVQDLQISKKAKTES